MSREFSGGMCKGVCSGEIFGVSGSACRITSVYVVVVILATQTITDQLVYYLFVCMYIFSYL